MPTLRRCNPMLVPLLLVLSSTASCAVNSPQPALPQGPLEAAQAPCPVLPGVPQAAATRVKSPWTLRSDFESLEGDASKKLPPIAQP